MTQEEKTKQIEALKNLGLTDTEIAEVQESDKRIDNGERLFELPKELRVGSNKARTPGNTKGYTRKKPIVKKKNSEKENIIEIIADAVQKDGATDLKLTNAEREFFFKLNGTQYKIVLSCPKKQSV